MHIQLRDVDAGDLVMVKTLVKEYIEETPFFNAIPFSDDEANNQFFQALSSHRSYIRLAYFRDELAGIFWGRLGNFFSTKVLFAFDVFCFVRPKFRGRKVADKILEDFENWALKNGCQYVRFVAFSSQNNEGVGAFLTRRGYKQSGTNLVKTL